MKVKSTNERPQREERQAAQQSHFFVARSLMLNTLERLAKEDNYHALARQVKRARKVQAREEDK